MSIPQGVTWMWPTPILTRHIQDADALNPALIEISRRARAADGAAEASAWASDDDVLTRFQDAALHGLAERISAGVAEIAQAANQSAWAELRPQGLRVDLVGMWFQASNRYARHDVHNHGNCSWSGVYYAQVDDAERRAGHENLGEANGLTRLHAPHLERLGGAHMDMGAAWMQDSHVDIAPEPGLLVVWPSWMLHQALPYDGEQDRIIVSFNAALHAAGGDRTRGFGF